MTLYFYKHFADDLVLLNHGKWPSIVWRIALLRQHSLSQSARNLQIEQQNRHLYKLPPVLFAPLSDKSSLSVAEQWLTWKVCLDATVQCVPGNHEYLP